MTRYNKRKLKRSNKKNGQSTVEVALLLPILVLLFCGAVQVIIYMQSVIMTEYAAFVAARSFKVYGDRTLREIGYQKIASHPLTNSDQTIAEAAAEAVLFESLLWEQNRIKVLDTGNFLQRVYEDGNNTTHGFEAGPSESGVVHVNFLCPSGDCSLGSGIDVSYCMPIVFPGIDFLFKIAQERSPCQTTRMGRSYSGIMVTRRMEGFGREPTEP